MSESRKTDLRRCLFFDKNDKQCLAPASFVCADRDGLQWFACQCHAEAHEFLRIPLDRFFVAVRDGKSLTDFWEAGPSASPEARRALAMCVCNHRRGQHALRAGVLACTVDGCACGPGCIHQGFVDKDSG